MRLVFQAEPHYILVQLQQQARCRGPVYSHCSHYTTYGEMSVEALQVFDCTPI